MRESVNALVVEVVAEAGISADDILNTTFVGNPTMHHLLLGIDPVELGGAPFALATNSGMTIWASELGLAANPPNLKADLKKRGKVKQTKTHNLLLRLKERQADYLRFMTVPQAEFDNNQAERDLRMNKVKMKVSGCFRSPKAGQEFMAVRSLVATAIKQGVDPIQALRQVLTTGGSPYMSLAKSSD